MTGSWVPGIGPDGWILILADITSTKGFNAIQERKIL